MAIALPAPIDVYFSADAADHQARANCFAPDAVVRDEGRVHTGVPAIAAWMANASRTYSFTSTPVACESRGGRTVVRSRVAGNFPGSPVDLRYAFVIQGGKIASLEIAP